MNDSLKSRMELEAAIKIMRDSLVEFGYQDRALSEGLDLAGEIELRVRAYLESTSK